MGRHVGRYRGQQTGGMVVVAAVLSLAGLTPGALGAPVPEVRTAVSFSCWSLHP